MDAHKYSGPLLGTVILCVAMLVGADLVSAAFWSMGTVAGWGASRLWTAGRRGDATVLMAGYLAGGFVLMLVSG